MSEADGDIRASWYRRLPAFAQGPLTWLSAKPFRGQRPTAHTGTWHVATGLAAVVAGLAIFALGRSVDSWALQIASWAFTTSGVRKLQVVVFHHCAHGTVLGTARRNAILGEVLSGLLLIKSFAAYKRDHARHHSSKYLLSPHDETVQFLTSFAGLVPGVPKRRLWQRLVLNFANPLFHLRWLADRAMSSLWVERGPWQVARIAYWVALVSAVAYLQIWPAFLLGWVVPLTLCYNVSATLRLAAEHRWPGERELRARAADFVCDTTVAVFLGAPLPRAGWRRPWAMPLWLASMFGHLLARALVLVGDTPCHDYHHRRPGSTAWANYIFARQSDVERGCPGYPRNYTEVWGLLRAIDENLASLSAVDPASLPIAQRRLPALWVS